MTRDETVQVLSVLRGAYPQFYRGTSKREALDAINLWAEMFADDPVELVAAAVKTLIVTDEKGFPPHIGAVKAQTRQLQQPETMTELEAWRLVRQAIWGASMEPWSRRFSGGKLDQRPSAQRNFDALPPVLQGLVGDPAQLAVWAEVPKKELETVVQSNFMRSYRDRAAQVREFAAIPADIKAMLRRASGGLCLREETDG